MKKSTITITTIIKLALYGFITLFIIAILFFPEQLFAKTRDVAFSFGLGDLPEEKPPEFAGTEPVHPELEQFFNNLVSTIENPPAGDSCLVEIGEIPDLRDLELFLSDSRLGIRKRGRGGVSSPLELSGISSSKLCFVIDDASLYFYNCHLGNVFNAGGSCSINLFPSREGILNGNLYSKYLFKSVQNLELNFCFIRLYSDEASGTYCEPPRNNGRDGIDLDCENKIENNIVRCGEDAMHPFKGRLMSSKYTPEFVQAAVSFSDAVEQAANSQEPYCRVEFDRYPGLNNQRITMFDDPRGIKAMAYKKSGNDDFKDPVELEIINGFSPCIIHGRNFWEWLWNGDTAARDYQHIPKIQLSIWGDGSDGIGFIPKDEEDRTRRDLAGGRPLIYKTTDSTGNKHICIIHAFADNNNNCDKDKNIKRNAVDDDCIYKRGGNDRLELSRTPVC